MVATKKMGRSNNFMRASDRVGGEANMCKLEADNESLTCKGDARATQGYFAGKNVSSCMIGVAFCGLVVPRALPFAFSNVLPTHTYFFLQVLTHPFRHILTLCG